MKKLMGTFYVIVILGLLLAGCQSKSNGSSDDAGQTRTIETAKGPVEVPANPQRIAIYYYEGDLLALGIKPAAAELTRPGAAFEHELTDTVKIGYDWEPESVMAANPDLIIVNNEEMYESLHQIAPTIVFDDTAMTAEERILFLGKVVGKEEEARKVADDFVKAVEEAKATLADKGVLDKTITTLVPGESQVWVFGYKYGMGGDILYTFLQMKAPEPIQKEIIGGEQWREVSLEVLPEYSGDYLMVSIPNEGPNPLVGTAVWDSLPAVANGHVINFVENLFYYADYYSMNVQLDFIVNGLLQFN